MVLRTPDANLVLDYDHSLAPFAERTLEKGQSSILVLKSLLHQSVQLQSFFTLYVNAPCEKSISSTSSWRRTLISLIRLVEQEIRSQFLVFVTCEISLDDSVPLEAKTA